MKKFNFLDILLAPVFGLIIFLGVIIFKSMSKPNTSDYLIENFKNILNWNWLIIIPFILIIAWDFFWGSIHQELLKNYPKTREKLKYKGSMRLMAIIEWAEIIKNSHPEDKEYTKIINMQRIGTMLYLLWAIMVIIYH
ncbi:MAG: hypothetical protein Q7R96_06375 [Nanoarchaeota archaeon]|nr:hypothetical protein [Nanoarchaeota archaeon]